MDPKSAAATGVRCFAVFGEPADLEQVQAERVDLRQYAVQR